MIAGEEHQPMLPRHGNTRDSSPAGTSARAVEQVRSTIGQLRTTRRNANLSQRALAAQLDWTQSEVNRLEQYRFMAVSVGRLSEYAAIVGLDLVLSLYPHRDSVRDRGHQRLLARFLKLVSSAFAATREAALTQLNDPRSWDVLLQLGRFAIGIEAETHVRDIQAFVRRIRYREDHGGVNAIVIVLSNTAHHRLILGELRAALGQGYSTPSDALLDALMAGRPVPGSGVVMV